MEHDVIPAFDSCMYIYCELEHCLHGLVGGSWQTILAFSPFWVSALWAIEESDTSCEMGCDTNEIRAWLNFINFPSPLKVFDPQYLHEIGFPHDFKCTFSSRSCIKRLQASHSMSCMCILLVISFHSYS